MLTSLRRNITENKPSKEAIYDIIGMELSYKAGILSESMHLHQITAIRLMGTLELA